MSPPAAKMLVCATVMTKRSQFPKLLLREVWESARLFAVGHGIAKLSHLWNQLSRIASQSEFSRILELDSEGIRTVVGLMSRSIKYANYA